jgi:hypothetical protein
MAFFTASIEPIKIKVFLKKCVHFCKTYWLETLNNCADPFGLVDLPYVMWSAHFFVTHIQTEKISSWNGPTVHVCCFMLARASTKTFVSRIHVR